MAASRSTTRWSFSTASAASRSRTRSARNACTRSRCSEPASPPPSSDSPRRAASIASTQGTGSSPAARARSRFLEASARAASTAERCASSRRRRSRSIQPHPAAPKSAVASTDAARASVNSRRSALTDGPGLGPCLGQLGLAESSLDAAKIVRQPGHDDPRVSRPMLRRGGEARPRQGHQLRVGIARVESCDAHPKGRPSPPCGTTPHRLSPRTPAGRSGSRRGSSPGRRHPPVRRACRARPVPARVPCTTAFRAPSPGATPSPPIRSATCRRRPSRRSARIACSSSATPPWSSTLARPQSMTCTSPKLPTMMFDGFRSRWITPRAWA